MLNAFRHQRIFDNRLQRALAKVFFVRNATTARVLRRRRAHIPEPLEIETFPFKRQPKLNRGQIMSLYDSFDYMTRQRNVVWLGPTGCGKTGLATGFLLQAIDRGYRGCFTTFAELVAELYASLADRSEAKVIRKYASFDCLVIDEVGYVEVEAAQVGLFFTLMQKRHKRCQSRRTAGNNIELVTAGENISGNVDAGNDIEAVISGAAPNVGGDISGFVKAGKDIGSVTANPNFSASGTMPVVPQAGVSTPTVPGCGLHIQVTLPAMPAAPFSSSRGNIFGAVTAGLDIGPVHAGQKITGNVDAGGRIARVMALDDISGNISSRRDVLPVSSWGEISGHVTAVGLADVKAYRDILAPIKVEAFGYAMLIGFADVSTNVTATTYDASVISWGNYTGNVTAGESVGVIAQCNVQGTMTGTSGAVYVEGIDIQADMTAETGVKVEAWGNLSGTLTGKLGVDVWAKDNVGGRLTSSEGAVTSWSGGTIAAPVDAVLEANITTWVDVIGQVNVSSGPATVWAHGDIANTIDAAWEVEADAWGSIIGNINAGGFAQVWAANDITGDVNAAGLADVSSWKSIQGAIDAGADAVVSAFENIEGDITAAENVLVDSYSDVANNVGTVMTYGSFGGAITAGGACPAVPTTPESVEACGVVHSVLAKSDLGGSISAENSINEVRAGGFNSASLLAPFVGTVTDYDATVLADAPPAAPVADTAGILASAAADFAVVLAFKADVLADVATSIADLATAKAATATELAAEITDIAAEIDRLTTDAAAELSATRAAAQASLTAEQALAAQEKADALAEAAVLESADAAALAASIATGNAEHAANVADADAVKSQAGPAAAAKAQEKVDVNVEILVLRGERAEK